MNFLKRTYEKIKNNPEIAFYVFMGLYIVLMIALGFFRDMTKDEAVYYKETWLIADLIKSGNWIGDYGVGLHGFLFKLPPALLFLILGESIDLVTGYNILLGLLAGFLLFRLLKKVFKNTWYSTLAVVFMMTSFHFVISMPTYLREIPSLLSIVIFLYAIVKNWNKYWLSLIFLLLLDSKEYVFIVFAVFYVIWLLISSPKPKFLQKIWEVFKICIVVFLPSLVWMVLMFTTSIIPVNMYLASILGLINGDFTYALKHFGIEPNSNNTVDGGNSIALITSGGTFAEIYNTVMAYAGKILYPRTFSFLSVPKVVIFPIVFSSFILLRDYIKSKKKTFNIFVFSSLLTLVWLLFYILRTSHGRYLLPILPMIGILLVYVLFFNKFTKQQIRTLLIGTGIFILLGFVFESSFLVPKIILETSLLIILAIFLIKKTKMFRNIFIPLIAIYSLGVALLFSYTQGQIGGYMDWGRNRQVEEIAAVIPDDVKFWSNATEIKYVISVENNEEYMRPEWEWKLRVVVPKEYLLKVKGEPLSDYYLPVKSSNSAEYDLGLLKKEVIDNNIEKMIIMYSTLEDKQFSYQVLYKDFLHLDWLQLEKKVELKNKIVYVFDVKN